MNAKELTEKLQAGYELANRGTGWWLSTPKKAYVSQESVQLDSELVDSLEAEGAIKVTMLTTSLVASLVAPNK